MDEIQKSPRPQFKKNWIKKYNTVEIKQKYTSKYKGKYIIIEKTIKCYLTLFRLNFFKRKKWFRSLQNKIAFIKHYFTVIYRCYI